MIETPDDSRSSVTPRERKLAVGACILGRYRIVAELGQGGMGIVYKCLDEKGGVEVAVKCLPWDVSRSSADMEDVRKNYQIVQGLVHDKIAVLKTLDCDESGDYFVVMELARGVNLKKWAERHAGPENAAEKIAILRQIAQALDYAHSTKPKYVIHRDVKPENVMVDEDGRVKVLDFGLAAQVQASMMVVISRSGTAAYKSPEQWLAQSQTATADQYSLGVVAYFLFAGRPPFDSDDLGILRHAVLHDPIPPIDGLARPIFRALQKALAKKAQDRFDSCGQFVDALEGKVSFDLPGEKWPAGKVLVAGIVASVAIAAGILAFCGIRRSAREEEPRQPVSESRSGSLTQKDVRRPSPAECVVKPATAIEGPHAVKTDESRTKARFKELAGDRIETPQRKYGLSERDKRRLKRVRKFLVGQKAEFPKLEKLFPERIESVKARVAVIEQRVAVAERAESERNIQEALAVLEECEKLKGQLEDYICK